MRAVRVEAHGGPERLLLADIPRPEAGPGEVLVRVAAIGVNHLDVWVRKGVPGHMFPLPITLGCDGAGTVEQVGAGVRGVEVGDQVVLMPGISCGRCAACLKGRDNLCPEYGILGETRDGTCAEFVVVPAVNAAPKPTSLSFAKAAAFPLVFLTAFGMLAKRAQLQAGETVLILAAGSGVGSAGLQIARMLGARVIAVAGGPEKTARAKAMGADHVIDHQAGPFRKVVRELTEKRGVDVVMEQVGAATFNDSVGCLARGGRLVTCGATSGATVTINLAQLFFKNLSYLGSTMGCKGDLLDLLALAATGKLSPVVDRVLPLADVAKAHALLEERKVFGKVVLDP